MSTSAELCRRNGWSAGTVLESVSHGSPTRVQITAVGRDEVLAVQVFPYEEIELLWDLSMRDWSAIPRPDEVYSPSLDRE